MISSFIQHLEMKAATEHISTLFIKSFRLLLFNLLIRRESSLDHLTHKCWWHDAAGGFFLPDLYAPMMSLLCSHSHKIRSRLRVYSLEGDYFPAGSIIQTWRVGVWLVYHSLSFAATQNKWNPLSDALARRRDTTKTDLSVCVAASARDLVGMRILKYTVRLVLLITWLRGDILLFSFWTSPRVVILHHKH